MTEVKKDKKIKKEPKERKRLTPSLAPIAKVDVVKFGATKHCKGCEFYEGKRTKRTPHCMPCKLRFQYLFIEKGYKKGLKMRDRMSEFLQPREKQRETEPMEVEPAPINEEPINEHNEIEDLYEINFSRLTLKD